MSADATLREPPRLCRLEVGGVVVHTDAELRDRTGVVVAFSERSGGLGVLPYETLNLAGHVGDDPGVVDENRRRLLEACGIGHLAQRLVTAEQVHGVRIEEIAESNAGEGAWVTRGLPPVQGTDAMVTGVSNLPLMMFFADCVPIVLVAVSPTPAVGVVHAGWRGALAGLAGKAVHAVSSLAGGNPSRVRAYIGAHIGACCYGVDEALVSQFSKRFGTICAVDGRLDLSAAVVQDMMHAGVDAMDITTLDTCTRDHTDRFFSYRARPVTGRHGALAAITKGE